MFEWLSALQHRIEKQPDYATKTLAAYSRGMRAGSIRGIVVEMDEQACCAAKELPCGQVYDPKDAPQLPLRNCTSVASCRCIYRPVMSYAKRPS